MKSDHSKFPWILALLCTVVFMSVMNSTMINVALPFIGRDFDVSEGTYGWMVTGFAMTFGIFSAVNGRLGDILGVKRFYLIGITLFGLASLLVAFTPSINTAIAIRTLQGVGAAAMPVMGTTIITRLIPGRKRGRAMGIMMSVVGVGASIGPFVGGVLVQFFGWRSIFVFTAGVLLLLPIAIKILPEELNDTDGSSFDAFGAFLLTVGVGLLLFAFRTLQIFGVGWELALNVIVAITLHFVFWWWIGRIKEPFAPRALVGNLRYQLVAFVAFLGNSTRFGTIILVPIVLIEVHQLEPIWVGVVLFPGALAIAILSPKSGSVADKIGPRPPLIGGSILIVLGNLITAAFMNSPVGITVGMGLYGAGFAFIQSPAVAAVSQLVPKRYTGVGLGMFMMIFFVGGAMGTAISVTALEFQSLDSLSWLGLDLGLSARFSNAILVLTTLAVSGLFLARYVPSKSELQELSP